MTDFATGISYFSPQKQTTFSQISIWFLFRILFEKFFYHLEEADLRKLEISQFMLETQLSKYKLLSLSFTKKIDS